MNHHTIEEHLMQNAAIQNVPITGSMELLPLCNMNCDMCYVRLNQSEMERTGKIHLAEEWIEIGRQMQKSGVLFLQLTGGEPLLYPGFKEVYLALRNLGMIITINTNGTLLDEAWADFFSQHKPRRINITLYGASSEAYKELCHYEKGFEKTLNAIKLLKKRNVDVKLNGIIVQKNKGEETKLLDIAVRIGVPINIDTYIYPASRERSAPFNQQSRLSPAEAARSRISILKQAETKTEFIESAKRFLDKAKNPVSSPSEKMRCLAGKSSFAINWQGNLQPCVMLNDPCVSVFDRGFEDAWKTVADEVKKIRLNPVCSECTKRDVCQICVACALHESGCFYGIPEYMCQYTDEILNGLEQELNDYE